MTEHGPDGKEVSLWQKLNPFSDRNKKKRESKKEVPVEKPPKPDTWIRRAGRGMVKAIPAAFKGGLGLLFAGLAYNLFWPGFNQFFAPIFRLLFGEAKEHARKVNEHLPTKAIVAAGGKVIETGKEIIAPAIKVSEKVIDTAVPPVAGVAGAIVKGTYDGVMDLDQRAANTFDPQDIPRQKREEQARRREMCKLQNQRGINPPLNPTPGSVPQQSSPGSNPTTTGSNPPIPGCD